MDINPIKSPSGKNTLNFVCQVSGRPRRPKDPDVILAAVLRDPFDALRFASERLRTEAGYVEELVRRSKAAWLVQLPGLEHFRADLDFVERCEKVAGTGLVFTYYESSTCFLSMRKAFKATGASVPGGIAYDAVMAKLEEEGEGGRATDRHASVLKAILWLSPVNSFGKSARCTAYLWG